MKESYFVDKFNNHWNQLLGHTINLHERNKVMVIPHSETLNGYHGVFIFNFLNSYVISVPPYILKDTEEKIDDLIECNFNNLQQIFLANSKLTIGPTWLGYTDTNTFTGKPSQNVIELNDKDKIALEELRSHCKKDEWEHSDIELERTPILGIYKGNLLVAAGSYRKKGQQILSIGIVTHPLYRGKGYGKDVVSELTIHGLSKKAIMEYQTLESNVFSVRLAKSLGYQGLARTMSVRLK